MRIIRQKQCACDRSMTLYFAYGSNMSRALMRKHCPTANAIGMAALDRHRFVITADGYASVLPGPGSVYGVLWHLAPRDLVALDNYESVASGLYHRRRCIVSCGSARHNALIYIARRRGDGKPKPGYIELVIAAARDWDIPQSYIRALALWASTPPGRSTAELV
jgi:gamma-glutamylcyclotransferase (GGCT)/AIG2-like uncharacterized protein YtfP